MNLFRRREFLRALGIGGMVLPLVPYFETRAQDDPLPKRLVFFYSSNGTVRERWVPRVEGGELVLSPILAPLAAFKDRLLVVDGLDYTATMEKGATDGHYGGMNTALTGSPSRLVPGSTRSLATTASIDQIIAARISEGLRFPSLQLGVQVDDYDTTVSCLSFSGPMAPLSPQNDPYTVFSDVFRGLTPPDPTAGAQQERERLDRTSVLHFARGDLARLRARLGREEKQKMDAHLASIEQLEARLGRGIGRGAIDACRVPGRVEDLDEDRNADIPAIGRFQIDMLVMALACDLTRVGTVQYGRAGAQHRFTWLGPEFLTDPDNGPNDSTSGIHGLAHNDENAPSREKLARCHAWYAGELAYLLGKLQAIPEGDGTMLDNTLVVWMNELGIGSSHRLENTPWVLAGNVGRFFRTGRMISAPREAHNRLLLGIAHAFGLEPEFIGDPDYGREPLPDLG